ncbi:LysM peptidoglycan-binding domain-containing protein [Desulfococcaceae bacterium HSG8]|nr:LysM peptidoglycan-binding domain-containing protein [Desulfococcaceae bacterium HSG8]
MKVHIAVMMLLLTFLCGGCVQNLHNVSDSQDRSPVLSGTEGLTLAKIVEKANYIPPKPAPSKKVQRPRKKADKKSDKQISQRKSPQRKSPQRKSPRRKNPQHSLDKARKFCELSQEYWQKGEVKKALKILDQAYALILDVDIGDDSRMIREKEDLRFTISKRILELYASQSTTVVGKYNAIPILMNKHVRDEVRLLTKCPPGTQNSFFLKAYKRSGKYRPYIVEKLKKAGLPVELSWLPLIESGYRVNALSHARALGLWQFIHSTGVRFGLNRNKHIDERLDPEKSTEAAIAYLRALHKIFGDWTTVLAAYNCGEGRVLSVIREQNVNYLDNFWDLYERLPRETARYVPRFLATLHIVKNPKKYGLDSISISSPPEYENVTISKQIHLKDAASVIGISQKALKELNPELRHNVVPGEAYSLRVPPSKGDILLSKLDNIPVTSPPSRSRITFKQHRIKKGDTLLSIAKRYSTSVDSITRTNKISKKKPIVVGKTLKIPQKRTARKSAYKKKIRKRVSKHIVKKGDSLWNIAKNYGTTAKKILALNKLSNNNLRVGQILKVRGTSKKSSRKLRTYRVRHGDVPLEIAKRHKMPLKRFLQVNRLSQRSKIYPGQKLHVD